MEWAITCSGGANGVYTLPEGGVAQLPITDLVIENHPKAPTELQFFQSFAKGVALDMKSSLTVGTGIKKTWHQCLGAKSLYLVALAVLLLNLLVSGIYLYQHQEELKQQTAAIDRIFNRWMPPDTRKVDPIHQLTQHWQTLTAPSVGAPVVSLLGKFSAVLEKHQLVAEKISYQKGSERLEVIIELKKPERDQLTQDLNFTDFRHEWRASVLYIWREGDV